MDRTKWRHYAAAHGRILFVGTQAGCAQALKDCGVPPVHWHLSGLDKARFMLASTGKCPPKLLKEQLYGRAQIGRGW